jgi:hypothetical protein
VLLFDRKAGGRMRLYRLEQLPGLPIEASDGALDRIKDV